MMTDSIERWTNCRIKLPEKHLKERLGELFQLDYDILYMMPPRLILKGRPNPMSKLAWAIRGPSSGL
jgi:hypothetical protein